MKRYSWRIAGKSANTTSTIFSLRKSRTSGDLIKKKDKQLRTVWDIPNNKDRKETLYGKHPTQKPLRLFNRIISISGKTGGVVLSPFAGSGTECVAAKMAGMSYIGFETEKDYVEIATKRLKSIA